MNKPSIAIVTNTFKSSLLLESFKLLKNYYSIFVFTSRENADFPSFSTINLKTIDSDLDFMHDLENRLEGFDLIICDGNTKTYAYQCVKAKKKYKNKLLFYSNAPISNYPLASKKDRSISYEAGEHTDHYLTHSTLTLKNLLQMGVGKNKITKLGNYCDLKVFHPSKGIKSKEQLRNKLNLSENKIIAVCMTPIEKGYGCFTLVNAVKSLEKRSPSVLRNFQLIFYSSGSLGTVLRQYVDEMNLNKHISFMPKESRDSKGSKELKESEVSKKSEILSSIDIYIDPNPGVSENFDDTAMSTYNFGQALASGLPVLAVKNYFNENFILGHGFSFLSGQYIKLASYLTKLLESKSLRNKMSLASRNYAEKHMRPQVVVDVLNSVISNLFKKQTIKESNQLDLIIRDIERKIKTKNYVDAIDLLENCLKIKQISLNQQSKLYRNLGDCFTKLGDYQNGEHSYQQGVKLNSNNHKAWIGLGTIKLQMKLPEEAIPLFQKAIVNSPDDPMASLGLSLALQRIGQYEEALSWCVKSLDYEIDNTASIYTLTQLAYQTTKFGVAEKYLTKFVDEHPNDTDIIYSLAGVKHKLGKDIEVKELLHDILTINPNDQRAIEFLDIIKAKSVTGTY